MTERVLKYLTGEGFYDVKIQPPLKPPWHPSGAGYAPCHNLNPFSDPIGFPLASISACIFGRCSSRRKQGHFSMNFACNSARVFANLSCWARKMRQSEPAKCPDSPIPGMGCTSVGEEGTGDGQVPPREDRRIILPAVFLRWIKFESSLRHRHSPIIFIFFRKIFSNATSSGITSRPLSGFPGFFRAPVMLRPPGPRAAGHPARSPEARYLPRGRTAACCTSSTPRTPGGYLRCPGSTGAGQAIRGSLR